MCNLKIFLLSCFILFAGCKKMEDNNKVGVVDGQEYVITTNTEYLEYEWSKILKDNKLDGKLLKFEIKKDFDTNEIPREYYFLVSYSSDMMIKVATEIIKKGNVFYFSNTKEQRIVVCHGTKDCMPKKFKDGNWGCDSSADNLFECKKTEVIVTNK